MSASSQPAGTQDGDSSFGSDGSSSVLDWKPSEPISMPTPAAPTRRKPLSAISVQVRERRSNGRKLPFDIMVIKRSLPMISVVLRLFVQRYQQLCHQKLLNPTHWTFNISWTALRHTSPHLRIYWTWSKCVECKIRSGYQCWVPHSPQSPLHRDCPSPLQKEDRVDLGYMTSEKAYRIVLAGDANVGKSSFLLRLCKNEFTFNSSSTLGEHSSQLFVNH